MPRSQDPARPTGAHWGAYDSTEELPNVAGSPTQTPELTQYDLAAVAGELLICDSPARGAARWRPVVPKRSAAPAPAPPASYPRIAPKKKKGPKKGQP